MRRTVSDWDATVTVSTKGRPDLADWIARSLAPEAARELSRAEARVRERRPGRFEVSIRANDAGAMRAALNTYLAWIHLSLATARAAEGKPPALGART